MWWSLLGECPTGDAIPEEVFHCKTAFPQWIIDANFVFPGLSADRKELSAGKGLGLVINQIKGNGDLIIDKKISISQYYNNYHYHH